MVLCTFRKSEHEHLVTVIETVLVKCSATPYSEVNVCFCIREQVTCHGLMATWHFVLGNIFCLISLGMPTPACLSVTSQDLLLVANILMVFTVGLKYSHLCPWVVFNTDSCGLNTCNM